MTKSQYILIGVFIAGFIGLTFFGRTKPHNINEVVSQRQEASQTVTVENLLIDGKLAIEPNNVSIIDEIMHGLEDAETDEERIEIFKQLSGSWYNVGNYILSAHYAEEAAKIGEGEESWSIAGINYNLGFRSEEDEKIRNYGFNKAIECFENAISENPKNSSHKINLALCYIENQESVMQGVGILRSILADNPDDVGALLTLGRLSATKTFDYDNAIKRLSRVVTVEPDNYAGNFYLAQSYRGKGDNASAKKYFEICLNLAEGNEAVQDEINQILKEIN